MIIRLPFFQVNMGSVFLLFCFQATLLASAWTTTVSTEEGTFTFGGLLLEEEKPLVGKWKGVNQNGEKWEIIRRPNHLYSIQINWMEEGGKLSFRGHGLWAVRNDEFIFVDIIDRDMETDNEWPIDVRNRIADDELVVIVEKLKSSSSGKVVTGSKEYGDSVETKVAEFDQLWMMLFDQPKVLDEARLFDQIQLARIVDLKGIVDFFTDPDHPVDKKLSGKWESTDNDPDPDFYWKYEFIRRPDGTDSGVAFEEDDDTESMMSHGLWGIRNGKYYGIELFTEGEPIPFEETFLFADKIAKSTPDKFVTQWVDTERKVLKFLPLVISVTDKRINQFETEILNEEFSKKAYGLKFIRENIK